MTRERPPLADSNALSHWLVDGVHQRLRPYSAAQWLEQQFSDLVFKANAPAWIFEDALSFAHLSPDAQTSAQLARLQVLVEACVNAQQRKRAALADADLRKIAAAAAAITELDFTAAAAAPIVPMREPALRKQDIIVRPPRHNDLDEVAHFLHARGTDARWPPQSVNWLRTHEAFESGYCLMAANTRGKVVGASAILGDDTASPELCLPIIDPALPNLRIATLMIVCNFATFFVAEPTRQRALFWSQVRRQDRWAHRLLTLFGFGASTQLPNDIKQRMGGTVADNHVIYTANPGAISGVVREHWTREFGTPSANARGRGELNVKIDHWMMQSPMGHMNEALQMLEHHST